MENESTKRQQEVYDLAVNYLKEFFPLRFKRLKEKKIKLFISPGIIDDQGIERPGEHSLERKIKSHCYEFIYNYCFMNTFRFKGFLKQFSSIEDYAKSIAFNALQENFSEYERNLKEVESKVRENKQIRNELGRLNGLDRSNPNEQKLFGEVWGINEDCNTKNIKFSPYATFKKINDEKKYISSELIQPIKFSSTPLYGRYKQYRKRRQKGKK